MRIATLYDIHGNLPALEAVIAQVHQLGVDQIVVGGDVVPGPMPNDVLDLLFGLEIPTAFILGNGDREVLSIRNGGSAHAIPERFRESVLWVADTLADTHAARVAQWVPTVRFGDVLFCHATPRNDTDVFFEATDESKLKQMFEETGASLVVCGHTHMQFDRMVGKVRVVNSGSIGSPFGQTGAFWLLIDGGPRLMRTEYDLREAAERIGAARYPNAQEFALRSVLDPPSKEQVLERFREVELR